MAVNLEKNIHKLCYTVQIRGAGWGVGGGGFPYSVFNKIIGVYCDSVSEISH